MSSSTNISTWIIARPTPKALEPTPSEKIETDSLHNKGHSEIGNILSPNQQAKDKKVIKQAKKIAKATDDTIVNFCDKRPKKFTGYCMMVALKVVKQTINPKNGKDNVLPLFFYTSSRELARHDYSVMEGARVLDEAYEGIVARDQLAISRYVKGKIQEIFIHENTRSLVMEKLLMGEPVQASIEGKIYQILPKGSILRIKISRSEKPLLRAFAEGDDFHHDLQRAAWAVKEKCKNMRSHYLGNANPREPSKTFSKLQFNNEISIEMIKIS